MAFTVILVLFENPVVCAVHSTFHCDGVKIGLADIATSFSSVVQVQPELFTANCVSNKEVPKIGKLASRLVPCLALIDEKELLPDFFP